MNMQLQTVIIALMQKKRVLDKFTKGYNCLEGKKQFRNFPRIDICAGNE